MKQRYFIYGIIVLIGTFLVGGGVYASFIG